MYSVIHILNHGLFYCTFNDLLTVNPYIVPGDHHVIKDTVKSSEISTIKVPQYASTNPLRILRIVNKPTGLEKKEAKKTFILVYYLKYSF